MVFATGYNYSFPFLPSALQAQTGYRLQLFHHVFPPTLAPPTLAVAPPTLAVAPPTLAVVGFIHGFGSINGMAEMQARWATRVFKGTVNTTWAQGSSFAEEEDLGKRYPLLWLAHQTCPEFWPRLIGP